MPPVMPVPMPSAEWPYLLALQRLALAVTLGLFAGFERQRRGKEAGLRSDQTIVLRGPKSARDYPDTLRRISYIAPDNGKRLIFLTNNFQLSAVTIARLYRCRWQVELFFKWIKQHLRIKTFLGLSPNAVKTQIWVATSIYLMVAILKKRLAIDRPISEIHQILSMTLFEKTPLFSLFCASEHKNVKDQSHNPMPLFNF